MIRTIAFAAALLLFGCAALVGTDLLYLAPEARGRTELEELRATLADYDRRLAKARAELSQLHGPISDPASLVLVSNEAESVPWLQSRIRQAVAATGGIAMTSQTGSTPLSEQRTKLSLLLRASFEEGALLNFLKQVESGMPPLIVESLAVQPTNAGRGQPSLDVTATIFVIVSNAAPT